MASSDRSPRRAPLAIAACVASILACRQIVGITTDPPYDDTAGADAGVDAAAACGIAIPSGACASCANEQCCDALAACAAEPGCAPFETCALACAGDPACRSRCLDDHPTGAASAMAALDACLAASCGAECALRCGGPSPITPPTAAAACETCTESKACSARSACADDPQCGALAYCFAGCSTLDCRAACGDAHDAGVGGYLRAAAALVPCATDCAEGNDWRCVDHVGYPPAKADMTRIDYQVTAFGTPVLGATVSLCGRVLPSCAGDLTSTTNADGIASFGLPQTRGVVGTFLVFKTSSPSLFPTIDYWPSPFSEARARIGLDIPDPRTFAAWAKSLGVTLDPARGHIGVEARDCQLSFTPGATYAFEAAPGIIDQGSVVGYFSNDVPTTATGETDRHGLGGIFNVNPGNVTITVTPKRLGKPSSRVTVAVYAGTLTHVTAQPQP